MFPKRVEIFRKKKLSLYTKYIYYKKLFENLSIPINFQNRSPSPTHPIKITYQKYHIKYHNRKLFLN